MQSMAVMDRRLPGSHRHGNRFETSTLGQVFQNRLERCIEWQGRQQRPPMTTRNELKAAALLVAIVEQDVAGNVAGWLRAGPIRVVLMPRHNTGMVRRLSKHLIVKETQTIDAQQFGTGRRNAHITNQLAERIVHTESTEEVAYNFVRAFRERSFYLVEAFSMLLEVVYDLGNGRSHSHDLIRLQDVDRANKAISLETLTQRFHRQ